MNALTKIPGALILSMIMLAGFAPTASSQSMPEVEGSVVDGETGATLPGVNVSIQGTTVGTATDGEGRYSLAVPSLSDTLVFSFIGYETQEVAIAGRSVVDVALLPTVTGLGDVLVVGYGEQRRAQVTGSIGRANPEDLVRVATPTVGQALQGRVAGVVIKNRNGQPGDNKTNINIRGFGEPLFIVDGLPVDKSVFEDLNPNDIAEINILRDAAGAAVYGARAGNGVVLVETKRGTPGDIQLSYRAEVGLQSLTVVPDAIPSWQHMALYNIELLDNGRDLNWSHETVELFRQFNDGSDPENYPSVDMFDLAIRDNAPMTTHNLSLRGGSDRVLYYVSGSWFGQTGMERDVTGETDTRYDRYTVRGNVDIEATERFDLSLDMSFNRQDFYGPRNQFEGTDWSQGQGIFARSLRWRPFHSIVELPGGHLNNPRGAPAGQTVNPLNLADADIGGSLEYINEFSDVKLGGEYDLGLGLRTRAVFNYQKSNIEDKMFQKRAPEFRFNAQTQEHEFVRALNRDTRVVRRSTQAERLNAQYFLEGNHSFGANHTLRSMYVFEYIEEDFRRFDARREQFQFQIPQLIAGPQSQQFNSDFVEGNKRMGHISRISYSYADKYNVEVNARYDGSARFPKDSRWGFFPAVSGAWNVTEESFLQNSDTFDFLTDLKLRASWGRLGFDGAGNFQFLQTYSFDDFVVFDGKTVLRTIASDGIPNPDITWEKMNSINFGLDAVLWDGLLAGSFDVFKRDRFDILGRRILEVPPIVGAELPLQNFQEFQNRGFDLSLRHTNAIQGGWTYSIGGVLGIHEEEIKFTDEPNFVNKEAERLGTRIGRPPQDMRYHYGSQFVQQFYLESDGLFTSQDEIDNWADIDGQANRTIQIGDARVVDRNGDGRITDADMYLASSGTEPRLNYGFDLSVGWKGFELSTFWQGAALFGYNVDWSEYEEPFPANGVALQHHLYDSMVPENDFGLSPVSAEEARWPRASGRFDPDVDIFLINGSYLRLKQLQFSYTLPIDLIGVLGANRMKVYVGGTNLLTFTDIDFFDPEIDTGPAQFFGNYHPQVRMLNFGIEVDF